jgi:hypothetical protein
MRVKDSIKLIKTPADAGRAGSRTKPPTAVARNASLEAEWPVSDHQKAKRRLTGKTVAEAIMLYALHYRDSLRRTGERMLRAFISELSDGVGWWGKRCGP